MHRLIRYTPTLALLCANAAAASQAATTPAPQDRNPPSMSAAVAPATRGYFRSPAMRGDVVVFVAEGDLWRVSAQGGVAQRLTTHAAQEGSPALSPDGRWLAFSASYEGPREVYVMPVNGGAPVRQTWDGANATVTGWTADGRVLYDTDKYATLPNAQLIAITPCLGETTAGKVCSPKREPLPLATAEDGSYSGDGRSFFFTRFARQSSMTKRYLGGTAENIWRWDDGASGKSLTEAKPLTADYPGTSRTPLWWNGRIYFASDRAARGKGQAMGTHSPNWDAGVMNIWSMNEQGGDVRQHTFHTDYDVQGMALDNGRIVYQQGADLWVLDLRDAARTATGMDGGTRNPASSAATPRKLDITLASDFDQMRENWVERPLQYLSSAHLSANGDRIALVSRGNVFVAPVGEGRFVSATHKPGVRYREARFMPGGKQLLTLSDASGEVELWTLPADGMGTPEQLTHDARILRWDGLPSPDGRWIVHHDKNQDLWLYDTKAKSDRRIAHSARESAWISSAPGFSDISWSPDGKWLAYNDVAENFLGRIVLYDTESGKATPVTTDRYDSYSPVWSPDGQWLWFLSDRTFQTEVGSPWGARQPDPYFDHLTRIYGLALKQKFRSPFAPRTELVAEANANTPVPAKDSTANGRAAGAGGAAAARNNAPRPPVDVSIDLNGIARRLVEAPVPAGDYRGLSTDGKRLYWLAQGDNRHTNLMSLAINNETTNKPAPVIEDVQGYELSADGRKLMLQKSGEIYVIDAGPKAPQNLSDSHVNLSAWKFSVDPTEEWAHNFVDAWRLERDYFYDPGMNGIDWPAMRTKYQPLADRVTDREELNDVLAQMVGELSALHIFVRGGDVRSAPPEAAITSLGATFERDDAGGGWRVAHIYRSDPDIPDELAPLAQAGVDVHEGDVITAIDGVPTLTVPDPAVLLRNKAGQQVRLSLRDHDVIVTPITQARERDLRYDEWEYTRRLAIDSLSNGKVGYVHLRAMGGGNIAEWTREYYPVFNRDGLIIDVRHNTGGNIDSWLLGKLLRQNWFWWKPRVGDAYGNMPWAFRGPIIVLVDEHTASDGEAFAEGFKRLGLGKVLGHPHLGRRDLAVVEQLPRRPRHRHRRRTGCLCRWEVVDRRMGRGARRGGRESAGRHLRWPRRATRGGGETAARRSCKETAGHTAAAAVPAQGDHAGKSLKAVIMEMTYVMLDIIGVPTPPL